jgi:hypothetical protein
MPSLLEQLLAKAQALPEAPVAIEAFWDGDTSGWFVTLSAVMKSETGYQESFLCTFQDGGDIRLFTGQAPPWVEARQATSIGRALAIRIGVPFYFASPEHPEDDCPRWWERDQGYPCRTCGIPLLQREPCPWRGSCHHCHLAAEKEASEAEWTPAERAGPRCGICGKPASGASTLSPRCAACLERYEDYVCSSCGGHVCIRRTVDHTDICDSCALSRRLAAVPEADREAIRRISVERGEISGMREAMRLLGCSLADAVAAVNELTRRDG